eukprot:scaffold48_cov311-Pinguiococcus_pyrenoidosus.AAC.294
MDSVDSLKLFRSGSMREPTPRRSADADPFAILSAARQLAPPRLRSVRHDGAVRHVSRRRAAIPLASRGLRLPQRPTR